MSKKKPVVSEWSRINIDAITIPDRRLRALREDGIAELVASFNEVGQLNPITVRPQKGGSYVLIAGLRRLNAARRCGWTSIHCIVKHDLDADKAELAEIDENLIRAELSPAERAMHVARRKKLFEKAHPETKHGGDRKSAGSSSQLENLKSFVADTAKKTGQGRSTVARDATRGNTVAVLDEIVGTTLDRGGELDALAKLPVDEQRKLAKRAKAGVKVSAKHAGPPKTSGSARKPRRSSKELRAEEAVKSADFLCASIFAFLSCLEKYGEAPTDHLLTERLDDLIEFAQHPKFARVVAAVSARLGYRAPPVAIPAAESSESAIAMRAHGATDETPAVPDDGSIPEFLRREPNGD